MRCRLGGIRVPGIRPEVGNASRRSRLRTHQAPLGHGSLRWSTIVSRSRRPRTMSKKRPPKKRRQVAKNVLRLPDLQPYLIRISETVRRNWLAVIPENARSERGQVLLQVFVHDNGSVAKVVRLRRSSDSESGLYRQRGLPNRPPGELLYRPHRTGPANAFGNRQSGAACSDLARFLFIGPRHHRQERTLYRGANRHPRRRAHDHCRSCRSIRRTRPFLAYEHIQLLSGGRIGRKG